MNLASYLIARGDFAGLVVVARDGLEFEPDHPHFNMFLGMALFQIRQFGPARDQLLRCLELELTGEMRDDVQRALNAIGNAAP